MITTARLVLILLCAAFAGCQNLPAGSYIEARTGFSKDGGATAKGVIHIPLR